MAKSFNKDNIMKRIQARAAKMKKDDPTKADKMSEWASRKTSITSAISTTTSTETKVEVKDNAINEKAYVVGRGEDAVWWRACVCVCCDAACCCARVCGGVFAFACRARVARLARRLRPLSSFSSRCLSFLLPSASAARLRPLYALCGNLQVRARGDDHVQEQLRKEQGREAY